MQATHMSASLCSSVLLLCCCAVWELTQPRGGGGSGCAVPRYRHIGCVVSQGAAVVSCCVRVIGTCATYGTGAGRATMTRRGGEEGGGGHRKVCRGTCRDTGKPRAMGSVCSFCITMVKIRSNFSNFVQNWCGLRTDFVRNSK